MFKYFLCFLLAAGCARISFAQSGADTLLMVPGKGGAYFYHVVTSKETIYSLSREFSLDPRKLASFNDLTLKSSLKLYQLLRIPLVSSNLDQSSRSPAGGMIPLYHKVMKGETLYHIGELQGKVPVALLSTWNHLKGNSVRQGQFLVVGWLKKAGARPEAGSEAPVAKKQPVSRDTELTSQAVVSVTPPTAPPAKKTAPAENNDGFLGEVIASENKRSTRNTGASNESRKVPVPSTTPAVTPAKIPASRAGTEDAFSVAAVPARVRPAAAPPKPASVPEDAGNQKQANTAIPEQELPAPVQKTPAPEKPDSFELLLNRVTHVPGSSAAASVTPAPVSVPPAADTPAMVKSEFQTEYDRQTADGANVDTEKGAAGWFRSNVKSGSGRYYALCNDLPRGTVVRVVNPINQKSVLAKVLDVIPKQKDNYNLIIKLSDAAMGDLGITQSRFWCELSYRKKDQ